MAAVKKSIELSESKDTNTISTLNENTINGGDILGATNITPVYFLGYQYLYKSILN